MSDLFSGLRNYEIARYTSWSYSYCAFYFAVLFTKTATASVKFLPRSM